MKKPLLFFVANIRCRSIGNKKEWEFEGVGGGRRGEPDIGEV